MSPLKQAIDLAEASGSPVGIYLNELDCLISDPVEDYMTSLKSKIRSAGNTRSVTYRSINTNLVPHIIYMSKKLTIPEQERIAFTRLRLSSHRLKIETGRWSRIPKEQRICQCGDVQIEQHVLLDCDLTAQIRHTAGINTSSMDSLMKYNIDQLCKYIHNILKFFDGM